MTKIIDIFNQIKEKLLQTNWFSFLRKYSTAILQPGNCAIYFQNNNLAVVKIEQKNHELAALETCEFNANTSFEKLGAQIAKSKLEGIACTFVLQPHDYKLFLLDMLPVKIEELRSALQWRVKDLIDFPVADALIDFFIIPATSGQTQKLYVVVVKKNELTTKVALLEKTGLKLQFITIPELCLRNIMALYPEDEEGIGLAMLYPDHCSLILTHKKSIYLIRTINIALTEAPSQNQLDALALEIQRSLDYYQNQLRQPPLSKLLISLQNQEIANYLSSQLTCAAVPVDLSSVLNSKITLSQNEINHCLIAIGGALEKEATHGTKN